MYKFGTVEELKKINLKLPDEVCKKAFEVVILIFMDMDDVIEIIKDSTATS